MSANISRDYYTRRSAELEGQLAAVEADQQTKLGAEDQRSLKIRAEQILAEINEIEVKLNELDTNSSKPNVRDRVLDKALQKIDFVKAKEIAAIVREKLSDDGGAVLFFVQRSRKQKGDYCIEEVFNVIMADEMLEGEIIADHRRIPVDLMSLESECDEIGFLTLLGGHFNIEPGSNSREFSEKIRQEICEQVSDGQTIFLKVESVDELIEQEEFLCWFINEFWKPLTDEIQTVSQEYQSKLIVALMADSQILADCSPEYFCVDGQFECHKMLELPVPDWTEDDICGWLKRFRQRFDSIRGKRSAELKRIAKRIIRASEGTPQSVCVELQEQFL